jgi:hypothetical protein
METAAQTQPLDEKTRSEMLRDIDRVTEGAKRNGYLTPVGGRPANVGTLANYAIGIKMVEDPREFLESVRGWIEVITNLVFDGIRDESILRRVASLKPDHEWINDFLHLKGELGGAKLATLVAPP